MLLWYTANPQGINVNISGIAYLFVFLVDRIFVVLFYFSYMSFQKILSLSRSPKYPHSLTIIESTDTATVSSYLDTMCNWCMGIFHYVVW